MFEFTDKVVVVTGAASGIGRAVTESFIEAGAAVVLADLDGDGASALADGLGEKAIAIACDVTDAAQVDAATDLALETFGQLDVMVNNAGICILGPLSEMTDDAFAKMLSVNLVGTFHGIRSAVARMPAGGAIINTASTAGLSGSPLIGGYGATKAGIVSLTRTAAIELRPAGIRVNCVCPAMTETPFSDALIEGFEAGTGTSAVDYFNAKQGRIGQPQDIAKVVLHLASDEAGWVTGTAYAVDGGLTAAYT